MSEQNMKFHPKFHKFIVNFALWAYAAIAVIAGIREILSANENGASNYAGVIVFAMLLILAGAFAVVTRFDLAALRSRAPAELLILCLATAVALFGLHCMLDVDGGDEGMKRVISAVIVMLWGISLWRYYRQRPYLFEK